MLSAPGGSNIFAGADAGQSNTSGISNSFFGVSAGAGNTTGIWNSFFGNQAGLRNAAGAYNSIFGMNAGFFSTGNGNSFFGWSAGRANETGNDNTIIGAQANVGSGNLEYATAIGAGAIVSSSNTIVLGRPTGEDTIVVPGKLQIDTLGSAGSTQLCRNSSNRVGDCSSSLRYKINLTPYLRGLTIINRLRPITFNWKEGGIRDLGFGAEDVEKIEPLLVTYNKQGLVEGVKYDRITVALVNAIKEQQEQIQALEEELTRQQQLNAQLKRQQNEIDGLKKLVCAMNPTAELCHK